MPGLDKRPSWVQVYERMDREEIAATVALTQADDADGAGSMPEPEHRCRFRSFGPWARACDDCGVPEPQPAIGEIYGPPDELLEYERVNGVRGDRDVPDTFSDGTPRYLTEGPDAPDPASLGWRKLDCDDQAEFLTWAEDQLSARLEVGERAYQSHIYGFQGDPLDHLIQELLDGLFYAWVERRRRHAERAAIDDRILALLWQSYCDGLPPPHSAGDAIDEFVHWLTHQAPSVFADQLPALREAWRRFVASREPSQEASACNALKK